MFKIIFISLALLCPPLFAQNFKLQENTNRADLKICQANHNMIIDKFISSTELQIARLIRGIDIESKNLFLDIDTQTLDEYKVYLLELVAKKLFFERLKEQLNQKEFENYISEWGRMPGVILRPENIEIQLEEELPRTLEEIVASFNLKISPNNLDALNHYLITTTLTQVLAIRLAKMAATLGSNIVLGFFGVEGGKFILRSLTKSTLKGALRGAGLGLVLNIAVLPLKGSRLPPEELWTRLLRDYPELILVPEWMGKAKIYDHPWYSHCNTIQRRTNQMEKALETALESDENNFIEKLTFIANMETKEKVEEEYNYDYEQFQDFQQLTTAVQDKTRLYIPPFYYRPKTPYWAFDLNE